MSWKTYGFQLKPSNPKTLDFVQSRYWFQRGTEVHGSHFGDSNFVNKTPNNEFHQNKDKITQKSVKTQHWAIPPINSGSAVACPRPKRVLANKAVKSQSSVRSSWSHPYLSHVMLGWLNLCGLDDWDWRGPRIEHRINCWRLPGNAWWLPTSGPSLQPQSRDLIRPSSADKGQGMFRASISEEGLLFLCIG